MAVVANHSNKFVVRCVASGIIVLAALLLSVGATAQTWRALGPDGGDVFALAMDSHDPQTLYLGCADGHIFGSHDAGDHWQLLGRAGDSQTAVVSSIVVDARDSKQLYASTWTRESHGEGGGVFRSSDGGVHWASAGLEGHAVRALAQAPSDPHELVAGALDGVFLSSDSGVTWRRISPANDAELQNVDSIAIDPTDTKIIYAGTFHLPWKTVDAGAHWASIHSGMIDDSDVFSVVVDRQHPERVFASACSGIYRSDNGGALWMKIQGIPFSARRTHIVLQDPAHPEVVYAGTTEGLWKTSDGGSNWALMTPANWVINSMAIDPRTDRVIIGTDQTGVMVSDDGGKFFRVSNQGFDHRQIVSFAMDSQHPGHLLAVLANAPETLLETNDNGRTWFPLEGKLDPSEVRAAFATPRGWIAALKKGGLKIYAPSFGIWSGFGRLHSGEVASPFRAVVNGFAFGPVRWFAATAQGLFVSADRGEMWSAVRLTRANLPAASVVASPDGRVLWVASSGGMLYSTDSGAKWAWKDLPIQSGGLLDLESGGGNVLLASSERGLYISRDAGSTWTLAAHGLPASPPQSVAVAGDVWIASMRDGGLYVSTDQGATWNRPQNSVADGFFPAISVAQSRESVYVASTTEGLYSLEFVSRSSSFRKTSSQADTPHSF
ncbi:MAG TPA: hypothetical protein VKB26_01220 [Candidatus Acidoferrales bacterium]|nr:hypothetical protein [Candidatus Acidoferrales bacterium]